MSKLDRPQFLEKCAALGVPAALSEKLFKAAQRLPALPAVSAPTSSRTGLEKAAYDLGYQDAIARMAQLQKR